jgi:CRP-like cAMP-binding protein
MAELSIEARLSQFSIFQGFSREELAMVGRLVEEREYQDRELIFRQNAALDAFLLVEDGAVREESQTAMGQVFPMRQAEAGDMVGRWAMFNSQPYPTTAYAHEQTKLLAFNEVGFGFLLETFPFMRDRLSRASVVNRLLGIPLFGSLSDDELFYVADLVKVRHYPAGGIVFEQGEEADTFYIIDVGQIVETATGTVPGRQSWPKYLTAGSFFGRYALLHGTSRRATAKAVTDVDLFTMSAYDLECLRKRKPEFQDALSRFDMLHHLRQTMLFSRLNEDELKELAGYVGLVHYRKDDVLFYQGETDPTFYILYEGEAVSHFRDEHGRQRPRGYLTAGSTVGEAFLFFQGVCDFTLTPITDTNWLYLTRDDLDLYLARHPGARGRLIPPEAIAARQQRKRFDWMEPEEELIFVDRRHWFALASRLVLPAMVILVAGLLLLVSPTLGAGLLLRALGIVFLVLGIPAIGWIILDWLNDFYVVTDKRAVHQEKLLLVRQTRDEAPLNKIQNVNIGRLFVGNLLGFGTLLINTAAAFAAQRVVFDYLADPEQVQAIILAQMEKARVSERPETRRAIRQSLVETVGPGIYPVVPRPVIPRESALKPVGPKPRVWARVHQATFQRWFWIERKTDGQVIWRKHWIQLIAHIWAPVLAILGLLVVLGVSSLVLTILAPLLLLPLNALLVLAFGWLWWQWENWGNDLYIVTEDRIIDTEVLPLGFRYQRTEATFDRIQNVSFEIPNPIATILNYGTVIVYTAGAEGRLDFLYIRDPSGVQTEIFRRLAAYEQAQLQQQREEQRAELPQWFSVYEERHRP